MSSMVIEHNVYPSYSRLLPQQKNLYANSTTIVISNDRRARTNSGEKYESVPRLAARLEDLKLGSDCEGSTTASSSGGQEEDEDSQAEGTLLKGEELARVEIFFKSHKTYVYVCHCLANLYLSDVENCLPKKWELSKTGVPVILLDKGETRQRTKRLLQLVLAERDTGFALWKDVIDNLSNYRVEDTFHTMYLSTDHSKMAGLSFDNERASRSFSEEVYRLTSDPLNISLSGPKPHKKPAKKKREKVKLPEKKDIGQPCCFQHITNVELDDKSKLFSLSTLVPMSSSQ